MAPDQKRNLYMKGRIFLASFDQQMNKKWEVISQAILHDNIDENRLQVPIDNDLMDEKSDNDHSAAPS